MTPKLDLTKLTPEQRDQLDSYNNTQKQLQSLNDIADMVQELVLNSDKANENTSQIKALGALLTDAREQLVLLNAKEAPEAPDYSKPLIDGMGKLEKAFKAINVAPNVSVDAPNVNIAPPDLTEFNSILRTDIPKAFEKAIKSIPKVEFPKTDNTDILKALEGISQQLLSIENATRLKPIPGSIRISNA